MSKLHASFTSGALHAKAAQATPAVRNRPLFWSAAAAAAAAALVVLGVGCTNMQAAGDGANRAGARGAAMDSGMESKNMAMEKTVAQAQLKTPEGADAGLAMLRSVQGGGVEISLNVQGMKPGAHGFHIHEKGECAPKMNTTTGKMEAFGAAGGHFDPHGTKTHGRPGQSSRQIHAGDVPNLVVGVSGSGMLSYTSQDVSLLPGDNSIMGRSLVVHENEDDYKTNPAGDSGPRIACGVIELVHGHTLDRSNMALSAKPAAGQSKAQPTVAR